MSCEQESSDVASFRDMKNLPDSNSIATVDHVDELFTVAGTGMKFITHWLVALPPGLRFG
jgi:hypothetical protein